MTHGIHSNHTENDPVGDARSSGFAPTGHGFAPCLPVLADRLRALRPLNVDDPGLGLVVTDDRTRHLRCYVRANGTVRFRWEYPAKPRLRAHDATAAQRLGTVEAGTFALKGDAARQAAAIRAVFDRAAFQFAPHQVHTAERMDDLRFDYGARYAVHCAWRRLLRAALDAGSVAPALSAGGGLGRDLQTVADALASGSGIDLLAALMLDGLKEDARHGARRARVRFNAPDVEYGDELRAAVQADGFVRQIVRSVSAGAVAPDVTMLRMARRLACGILLRIPDCAFAQSGLARDGFAPLLALMDWSTGRLDASRALASGYAERHRKAFRDAAGSLIPGSASTMRAATADLIARATAGVPGWMRATAPEPDATQVPDLLPAA